MIYGNMLPIGTVVFVRVGLVRHLGIVSDYDWNGMPRVISNSRRRREVAEESWDDFRQGRKVEIDALEPRLPVWEVIERALGEPWNAISFNCEHFVRWALGHEVKSPQLRKSLAVAGAAAAFLFFRGGGGGA